MQTRINAPRYREIAEQFRGQIKGGVLKPGDRLPSFTEMRREYGVNQATMERIHKVLEADRLIRREVGRGTFINHPQQEARSGIIGLCGHGFSYAHSLAYSAELMANFSAILKREKVSPLLLDDGSITGWEKVDGVLLYGAGSENAMRWLPAGTPAVSLLYPSDGMASVAADDFTGAYRATQHLIELGHKRIGYLTTMGSSITRQRLTGYRAALKEARIKPSPRWIRTLLRPSSELRWMSAGSDNMNAWLQDGWEKLGCTALLVQNDEAAVGAMKALQARGIKVPEDLSIVGFDNTEVCEYVTPRLTTVEVPLREIGAQGLKLLLRQIKTQTMNTEQRMLPVKLRVRESTAAPR